MSSLPQVLAVAARQHGVVHRDHLVQFGVSRQVERTWCGRGVFEPANAVTLRAVGSPDTWMQRVLIGIWGSGPQARASHRTASALWELDGSRRGMIETLSPYGGSWDAAGVRTHETRQLRGADVATVAGIPVTAIERTIIDCAAVVGFERLQEFLDDAVRRRLTTYERVADALLELPTRGRNGVVMIRDLLSDRLGEPIETKSAFETLMAKVLKGSDLPPPVRQLQVVIGSATYYLDFSWPEFRRFVECDSMLAHSTPTQLEHDLIRQNDLVEADWVPIRFTRRVVKADPPATVRKIRRSLLAGGWIPPDPPRSVTADGDPSNHQK